MGSIKGKFGRKNKGCGLRDGCFNFKSGAVQRDDRIHHFSVHEVGAFFQASCLAGDVTLSHCNEHSSLFTGTIYGNLCATFCINSKTPESPPCRFPYVLIWKHTEKL